MQKLTINRTKLGDVKTITKDEWIFALKYIMSVKNLSEKQLEEINNLPTEGYVFLPVASCLRKSLKLYANLPPRLFILK